MRNDTNYDPDDDFDEDEDDDDEETANRRLFGPSGPDGRSEITEPTEKDVIRELHRRGIYVPYGPPKTSFMKRLMETLIGGVIPCDDRGRPVRPGTSVSMATRTFYPSDDSAAKRRLARQEAAGDELARLAGAGGDDSDRE